MDSALKQHILSRVLSDLDFLQSQNALDATDIESIRSRVPGLSLTAQSPAPSATIDTGAPKAVPSIPARPVVTIGRARALWDYDQSQADDLPFKAGDIISITREENQSWWRGSCNGLTGLFPANYVERLPDDNASVMSRDSASSVGPYSPSPQPQQQQHAQFAAPSQQYAAPPQQYSSPANQAYYTGSDEKQALIQAPQSAPPQGMNADGTTTTTGNPGPPIPPKKPKLGKTGKMMATSFAGGLGFGAGASIASEVIHGIF